MKTLLKLRLINWHRFRNDTIDFSESVLLSGENGAGKSTILDAIQYAVTCSKANFNKAAHQEKGERNLNSYIRCKTGNEDHPYERTGELSAHIALEFFDDAKNVPFILGVVMDSSTEEKEPNTAWYVMENRHLSDDFFFAGKKVKGISAFRQTNARDIKQFVTTIGEAKKIILARFGRIEDKFFTLIPKALAFRPIHDIKDFVYSYVLDKKEVNIDALRENVRSYQDLERLLYDVRTRIGELSQIIECKNEVVRLQKVDAAQGYIITAADCDMAAGRVTDAENELKRLELFLTALQKETAALIKEKESKETIVRNLQSELDNDEEYRALKELERREAELQLQAEEAKRNVNELKKSAREAVQEAEQILKIRKDTVLSAYREELSVLSEESDITALRLRADEAIKQKAEINNETQQKIAAVNQELFRNKNELSELSGRIESLEKKKHVYPESVQLLKSRIETQFRAAGKTGEVRVLCELLEISDPAWRNAVEGYLNNQRFYLIVDPEYFDLALSVYDKLRSAKKVFGAGLIDTGKLVSYDTTPEGSLAEVVSAKSTWAGRYVNMVLGKVHRCENVLDLKNYPVSITKECMRYQNHVASAIRPEVFEVPYIGEEAYRRQLERAHIRKADLEKTLSEKSAALQELQKLSAHLGTQPDYDVRHRLDDLDDLRRVTDALKKCREDMKVLPAGETLIQKRMRLQSFEKERDEIQRRIDVSNKEEGKTEEKIETKKQELEGFKVQKEDCENALSFLETSLGAEADGYRAEYRKLRTQKDAAELKANYERSRKANGTLIEKAVSEMCEAMNGYKSAHNFGAPATLNGYAEFEAEHDKLKNSELLTYEEKVRAAKASAESEFREQFLSKLQENIKKAQSEFKELNRSLDGIDFSGEHYEFLHTPGKALKKYYDMIMDDFNVMEGESIFSSLFSETHKEVIEELFDKLMIDGEESAKTLEYFTDYRTYMDYDIRITGSDGSHILYSKVSREKSGGETQTPFYITVVASFMQLYRAALSGDSAGIVMLDEAFNNMDDERIRGILQFMTGKNLQLIISAPPEKIQYIGPYVEKVLLVLSDGRASYVEDFTHETLR